MQTAVFDLPAMYGDHHVLEVRRLLLGLSGVSDVYASSSFRVVEVSFDEAQVSAAALEAELDAAGYLGELPVAMENGDDASKGDGAKQLRRQTATLTHAGKTVSFVRQVPYAGRPLWPCPGLGVIRRNEEEAHG